MAETKTAATTDEDAAATKLQAIQRGREARAEVEELKEQTKAATKIQAVQRGKEDRANVEQLKTEKAAAAATTAGTSATTAAAAAAADGGAAASATPGAGDNAKPKKKTLFRMYCFGNNEEQLSPNIWLLSFCAQIDLF